MILNMEFLDYIQFMLMFQQIFEIGKNIILEVIIIKENLNLIFNSCQENRKVYNKNYLSHLNFDDSNKKT